MGGDYWIEEGRIRGPTDDGLFHVSGGYVFGPRNSGRYWIAHNGYLYGPTEGGEWHIKEGRFLGPDRLLPFMKPEH